MNLFIYIVFLHLIFVCSFYIVNGNEIQNITVVEKRKVTVLTDQNITTALKASPNWFIEFYTPWCKHCKKLAPIFKQLAEEVNDNVIIASVDCTKQKSAASTFKVDRYPTIIYKQGEEAYGTYEGPRDLESFHRFIERMLAPSYLLINDIYEIPINPSTDNVTFALMVDTTKIQLIQREESEEKVLENFRKISEKNKQDTSFVIIDMEMFQHSKEIFTDALHLVKFDSYTPLLFMPNPLDATLIDMEEFILSNNYPLINRFDNHNFKRLSGLHKLIIIAVIDPRQESRTSRILEVFQDEINKMDIERNNYIFGYLDGIKWRSFIKMHHTLIPSILVLDQDNDLHQSFLLSSVIKNVDDNNNELLKDLLDNIFQSIRDHTISMEWNETLPPTMSQKIIYRFKDYYPYSLFIILLPMIFLIFSCMTPYPKEKTKKQ